MNKQYKLQISKHKMQDYINIIRQTDALIVKIKI